MVKKNILLVLLIFPLLFISGCNYHKERNDSKVRDGLKQHIIIKKEDLSGTSDIFLSDLLEDYSIIKLETDSNCLVGAVKKIIVENDRIYILDNDIAEAIFVFDIKGKFLFKIGRKGKGPSEFMYLNDFVVDKKELIVLDAQKKRLYFYNKNGEILNEQVLPFFADNLEIINDKLLALTGSSWEHRLIIWDREAEAVRSKYFEYTEKNSFTRGRPFFSYNNNVSYKRNLNDTILGIKQDGEIYKKLFIDYGKYRVTDDKLVKYARFGWAASPDCMTGTRLFTETDPYIYFVFDYRQLYADGPFYVLFSKKMNKSLIYSNQSLHNDITFSRWAPQIKSATKDGKFVGTISSLYIAEAKERIKNKDFSNYKKQNVNNFQSMAKDVKASDNPLVILYSFRENLPTL